MIARPYNIPWGSPAVAVVLALLAGWGVGAAVALGSPVWALAAAAGLVAAWAVARSVQAALLGLIVVGSLLPFAVIPLRVGVALTFVDALCFTIVLGWLLRHVLPSRRSRLPQATKCAFARRERHLGAQIRARYWIRRPRQFSKLGRHVHLFRFQVRSHHCTGTDHTPVSNLHAKRNQRA